MVGLSLGLGFGRSRPFSPSNLFSGGEAGAWYDNQDLSTLFSNAARTTPAVVDGEVLGQTDKSGNGNHRTGSAGTGPILRQRSDGVYYLDYAGGKTLSVPSSTALFKYLHDGTGGSLLAFVEWPQGTSASAYVTTGSGTTNVGVSVSKSTSTQAVSCSIYRGASGTTVAIPSIARFALSSGLRMLRFSYKNNGTASDAKVSADSSLDVTTAATSNAPSTASASSNLTFTNTFGGKEYGCILAGSELTSAQVSSTYNYFRAFDYPVSADLTLILGGQSNMSGRGTVVTTLAEDKQVGVYAYTKAEEFRLATVPEHSVENRPVATTLDEGGATIPQHGFALRTGKKLNTDSGQDVLLVPCAIGSTSIAQWDTPATKDDRTTLFGAMKYRYTAASATGGSPVIVWYGHESNANAALAAADYTNGGVGTSYQTAFAQLIADIRSEIADAPLIFVQLASDDTLATAEAHAAAGEAQRQLELSLTNAYMVVAHDVKRNASADDIHVHREGMDVIGDRVALAIREHILGEVVNGTGPRIVSATWSGSTVTLTCDKAVNTTAGNYGSLFRVYANGVEQTVSSANRGANTSTVEIVCSAPLSGPVTLTYGYRAGPASAARTDFVKDSDNLPLPLFGPLAVTAA